MSGEPPWTVTARKPDGQGQATDHPTTDPDHPTPDPDRAAGPVVRAWRAWRHWRRGRPFWGGLLLILSGTELLMLPLPMSALGTIIHIGIGGVLGILIGSMLIACGLLLWFHPVQRIFYSIVGILLALAALIASNLGGFLLGTLLGVVGGSLAFGWAPDTGWAPAPRKGHRQAGGGPSAGLGIMAQEPEEPEDEPDSGPAADRPGGADGTRMLALSGVGLIIATLLGQGSTGWAALPYLTQGCAAAILCPQASQATVSGASSAASTGVATPLATSTTPAPSATPTPTASATPTPTPTASATPTPTPTASATPTPTPTASATPTPTPTRAPKRRRAAATTLTAAATKSVITAASAAMTGLTYDGVADVATADGTVQMLKFSMDSMTLSGGTVLTAAQGTHKLVTRDSSLAFTGNVVLYTTEFSADLLGVPVTFTPQNPPTSILSSMTFTDVATYQPFTLADSLTAGDLVITAN